MASAKKIVKKTQPAPKVKKIKKSTLSFSKFLPNVKTEYQKHTLFYPIFIIIVALVLAAIGLFTFNKGLFLAGTINGKMVTSIEFYQQMSKANGEAVFDSIIRDTLVQQEANKKNITVSDKELSDRLATIEKRVGGKDSLDKALAQNKTTLTELKRQIGLQLLAEKLLEKDIQVTDEEVAKYTQDNKTAVEGLSQAEIKDQVKSQKFNDKFTSWLDDIKKNAKINRYF